jgi:hypothetical protein
MRGQNPLYGQKAKSSPAQSVRDLHAGRAREIEELEHEIEILALAYKKLGLKSLSGRGDSKQARGLAKQALKSLKRLQEVAPEHSLAEGWTKHQQRSSLDSSETVESFLFKAASSASID